MFSPTSGFTVRREDTRVVNEMLESARTTRGRLSATAAR